MTSSGNPWCRARAVSVPISEQPMQCLSDGHLLLCLTHPYFRLTVTHVRPTCGFGMDVRLWRTMRSPRQSTLLSSTPRSRVGWPRLGRSSRVRTCQWHTRAMISPLSVQGSALKMALSRSLRVTAPTVWTFESHYRTRLTTGFHQIWRSSCLFFSLLLCLFTMSLSSWPGHFQ